MPVPEIDELIQKLEAHQRELYAQVRALSDEELREHPNGTDWSPKQQLAHLAAAERVWLEWALAIRDRPGGEVGPADARTRRGVDAADARTIDELLRELEDARAATLDQIRDLTSEELSRKARHVQFGELTVLQALRALYRHTRMHIDQIAGREPSFVPRTGG